MELDEIFDANVEDDEDPLHQVAAEPVTGRRKLNSGQKPFRLTTAIPAPQSRPQVGQGRTMVVAGITIALGRCVGRVTEDSAKSRPFSASRDGANELGESVHLDQT